MIQVAGAATVSHQPALASLLKRWPVGCRVDGERAVSDLSGGLEFPACILVSEGAVNIQLPGSTVDRLQSGDVAVVHEPKGVSFQEASLDGMPDSSDRPSWHSESSSERPAALIVRLECVGSQFSPGLMPRPYVVRTVRPVDHSLRSALIAAVRSQSAAPVADSAASAVYLQCMHEYLASHPREIRVLAGLFDPVIGPVMAALLDSPARDWTVESLAEVGRMSRSAFARKFREVMGAAPIDFLVEVRMWQAARQLRQLSRDMKSIAIEAGYQSAAAFSVAFKRWSGESPSDYRRRT
jgi:AraC-like DNA-binding protein